MLLIIYQTELSAGVIFMNDNIACGNVEVYQLFKQKFKNCCSDLQFFF